MALKRDSLIGITNKSSKSEKVTCIWIKFLGIVLVAQKFIFQWQTFNGEKERCHRKVLPSNCPLVCPQTFFVFFFFRQSATPPPCTCKGANSTVSKEKILPLGQLVNIFSSLLYDYMIVALFLKVRVSCWWTMERCYDPKPYFNVIRTRDLALAPQCSTNCAMKTHTFGADRFVVNPWKQWRSMPSQT